MVDRYASIYRPSSAERDMLWRRRSAGSAGRRTSRPARPPARRRGTWNVLIGGVRAVAHRLGGGGAARDAALGPVLLRPQRGGRRRPPERARETARRRGPDAVRGGPPGRSARRCGRPLLRGHRARARPRRAALPLCWMHRALKASSTVRATATARARPLSTPLAVGIERRDAPGLRRLFAPPWGAD